MDDIKEAHVAIMKELHNVIEFDGSYGTGPRPALQCSVGS
jgi:hypothetical protein